MKTKHCLPWILGRKSHCCNGNITLSLRAGKLLTLWSISGGYELVWQMCLKAHLRFALRRQWWGGGTRASCRAWGEAGMELPPEGCGVMTGTVKKSWALLLAVPVLPSKLNLRAFSCEGPGRKVGWLIPFALPWSRLSQVVGTMLRSLRGPGQFLPPDFAPWRSFPWQAAKPQCFISLPWLRPQARSCCSLSLHPSPCLACPKKAA